MSLLDHFHRPLSTFRHWQGFHSAWANELVRQLNDELLPERYFAEPRIRLGMNVEVDVGTFEQEFERAASSAATATEVWAPPRASLTAPLDWAGIETFEVQVQSDEEGTRLVAAIELISPGNKDRLATRAALAAKCAGYLQDGVGVVLVDIVTSRSGNLFQDLLAELRLAHVRAWPSPPELYAVACRSVVATDACRLEAWPHVLALGAELPTVPLWVSPELAFPVNLESSYAATCAVLRIPLA